MTTNTTTTEFCESHIRALLDSHLSETLSNLTILPFFHARISHSQILTRTIPQISQIELVSSLNFSALYTDIYKQAFPHPLERESTDLIATRLADDFAGNRTGLFPYRIIGLRSHNGSAIGAAHFSVLFLKGSQRYDDHEGNHSQNTDDTNCKENAVPEPRLAVPYLQYIYVSPNHRGQGMADLLHALVLAVSQADAIQHYTVRGTNSPEQIRVPCTLFETEPSHGHINHSEDERAVARERVRVHIKGGAQALMYTRPRLSHGNDEDGHDEKNTETEELVSTHCQPGLEVGDAPLTLIWAVRPNPAMNRSGAGGGESDVSMSVDVDRLGKEMIKAVYQSFRDEGFPEENIALAEHIVTTRCEDGRFVLRELDSVVIPRGLDE